MKRVLLILLFLTTFLFSVQKIYKSDINNQELQDLINENVVVVDIRTAPEWAHLGVIKNSKLITFFDERGRYSLDGFIASLKKEGIKKTDKIVIICRSGNRSVYVSNMLAAKGYTSVYNVEKGIKNWIRSGKNTTRDFK